MRRLTLGRKENLIKTTRDISIEERKPYLDEWEMNEEEFQLMKRRYDQHGVLALKQRHLVGLRRNESLN